MKVHVKLIGGLGNQLFIYAYARMLQEYYRTDQMIIDYSAYTKYKIRDLEINNLKLNSKVKFENEYPGKTLFKSLSGIFRICQVMYLRFSHEYLDFPFRYFAKLGFFFSYMKADQLPKKTKDSIYVYGYFQYLPNFDCIRDILLQELTADNEKYTRTSEFDMICNLIMSAHDPVAISVRCGKDYEKCGLNYCDETYYKKGLKRVVSEVSTIFVFSDDLERAKEIIKLDDAKIYFVPKLDPIGQLMLMKLCQKFVLSNSSFSWWGAYLSEYEKKVVIFPNKWFTYKTTKELNLLFSNYIVIE